MKLLILLALVSLAPQTWAQDSEEESGFEAELSAEDMSSDEEAVTRVPATNKAIPKEEKIPAKYDVPIGLETDAQAAARETYEKKRLKEFYELERKKKKKNLRSKL